MVVNKSFPSYGVFTMDEFEFENGEVLKDVDVEYVTRGTPRYDEEGNIVNAAIYCHRFNGNCHSIDDYYMFVGDDGYLKEFDLFFICISALGFPNSCSPSTTNMRHHFPKYTVKDRVNFRRQFLSEMFGIDHVFAIYGIGLGGYECYTWAADYPDEMDVMVIAYSSFKTYGYRYVASKVVDSIIESSDDYYSDVYNESLSRMMVTINKLIYSNYFSKKIFSDMTNDEIDVLMDDFVDEGLFVDIYDLKYRNDTVIGYDIEDKLANIRAKTLVISPNDDIYFTPELDVVPVKEMIKDSQIFLYDSKREYSDEEDLSIFKDLFIDFLKECKK